MTAIATPLPSQAVEVKYARVTGRAASRTANGRTAEEIQALDEALLRDLEEAIDTAETAADYANLTRARDAVATRVISRAARIERQAAGLPEPTLYRVPSPHGTRRGLTLEEAKARVEAGASFTKRGWTTRWTEHADGRWVYERANSRGRVIYSNQIIPETR